MNLTLRILRYYRPFAGRISLALGLLVTATLFNLLKPWPLKFVVDSVLTAPQGGIQFPWGGGFWTFPTALAVTCGVLVLIHLLWGGGQSGPDLHIDRSGTAGSFAGSN